MIVKYLITVENKKSNSKKEEIGSGSGSGSGPDHGSGTGSGSVGQELSGNGSGQGRNSTDGREAGVDQEESSDELYLNRESGAESSGGESGDGSFKSWESGK